MREYAIEKNDDIFGAFRKNVINDNGERPVEFSSTRDLNNYT